MQSRVAVSDRYTRLIPAIRQYQLMAACLVITLCFWLANDVYGQRQIAKANDRIFKGERKVIDYLAAKRAAFGKALAHSDLDRRYLIDARKRRQAQRSLLRAFAGGDACNTASETRITALPYSDPAGNLAGKVDNYQINGVPTGCPTCIATGGASATSGPRGAVYLGTGIGPDAAYAISFNRAGGNITATMDPVNAADDLSLLVYGNVCSDNSTDAIVISDLGSGGAPETVTITNMPAGNYHIVADTYSYYYNYYYYGIVEPGGPYTLNVNCVAGQTCIQPVAPTAASVTVAGNVRTADGRGLTNARVQITDQAGNIRGVVTGRNGHYQFDEVEAGQTYTIAVASRRYSFSPRVVSVTDNVADLDFTPDR